MVETTIRCSQNVAKTMVSIVYKALESIYDCNSNSDDSIIALDIHICPITT